MARGKNRFRKAKIQLEPVPVPVDKPSKILYGFPLAHPNDAWPADIETRFMSCSHCGNETEKGLVCSACSAALYCDATCQREAWLSGHKQSCKDLQQDRQTTASEPAPCMPPSRNATDKASKDLLNEAVQDWVLRNTQAILILAKLNVESSEEIAINHHTYVRLRPRYWRHHGRILADDAVLQILLLPRITKSDKNSNGFHLTINGVFRIHRDRDPNAYKDKYDSALVVERSDKQHLIHIGPGKPLGGLHALVPPLSHILDRTVLPSGIPVHALVNMFNSGLRDITVTASRVAPEYVKYMSKAHMGKQDNVIRQELKNVGEGLELPKEALQQVFDMMDEVKSQGLQVNIGEVGEVIKHEDGRKEYRPTGYTINGRPVPQAAKPYFDARKKHLLEGTYTEYGTCSELIQEVLKEPKLISPDYILEVLMSPNKFSESEKHLAHVGLASQLRAMKLQREAAGAIGDKVEGLETREADEKEEDHSREGECQIS